MTIFYAILLGIIQGLTEFIPVSSTAHLTLAGKAMGVINYDKPDEWTAFIAVIQLGSLLAVIAYFWSDILHITTGFVKTNLAYATKKAVAPTDRTHALLGWMVIVGTLPAGVIGLLFRHQIEGVFTKDLRVIGAALIALALVLIVAEIVGTQQRDMQQLRLSDAIVVGLAQVFALIPGCSRSGSTITGGLFAGLTRETAARFSFLLSIPAIGASGLLELPKAWKVVDHSILLVAIIAATLASYATIAFLIKFLQRHSTYSFAAYRIFLGVMILVLLMMGKISAS
ncbi:MAG: undecaprenyl-diphosphatase UppP [Acidobacteria bacterium]|nr:undecaprenyl-diphosphatase UppP [Acidobacteriota bacterium]